MALVTAGQNDDENDEEEDAKLRTLLAFLSGVGGGSDGESMPREMFRLVLEFLMPSWDPLRRGVAGMELPLLGDEEGETEASSDSDEDEEEET